VLGGTVTFNGTARGGGDVQTLAWDALARVRDISFPGWHQLLPNILSNLDSGTGAFEVAATGLVRCWRVPMLISGAINMSRNCPPAPSPIRSNERRTDPGAYRRSLEPHGKRVRVGRAIRSPPSRSSWQKVKQAC